MNDRDKEIFESIKEKSEQDKKLWHEVQKDHTQKLSPEKEEEILERMFLVYYVEKYLQSTVNEVN